MTIEATIIVVTVTDFGGTIMFSIGKCMRQLSQLYLSELWLAEVEL